jgi:hypothetical protein
MAAREKYHLDFEEHSDYFFACIEADELSPELTAEYQKKIVNEIRRRSFTRVMIERDIRLSNNSAELYPIPFMVDSLNIRHIKYAFVDLKPEHVRTYGLALLTAKDRGFDVEVFGDVQAAVEWLRGERKDRSADR